MKVALGDENCFAKQVPTETWKLLKEPLMTC